ncbi:NYN domain-containing protein [Frondihabitans cladoniiphilus]|uniref:NYN domain-containing protein n=1 Tax=Frondihabitans cladoniiphilus TaxID=715785 RepID=A0ABP8W5K1_9MICO
MRIGVYVDGFNLYYGARKTCGRSAPGWRWLDLRSMTMELIAQYSNWAQPTELRVVYCSARIRGSADQSGQHDQDTYLRALTQSKAANVVEMGSYVVRTATAPLATAGPRGKPVLTHPAWPLMVQGSDGEPQASAVFMASVARREEKGSDVNVASHLLIDVLDGRVDRAIVVSNDSDLSLPLREARKRVPVGTVNPTAGYTAGLLKGARDDGVGNHWWHQIQRGTFEANQLPISVGHLRRPQGW